jgi:hypothetical protein
MKIYFETITKLKIPNVLKIRKSRIEINDFLALQSTRGTLVIYSSFSCSVKCIVCDRMKSMIKTFNKFTSLYLFLQNNGSIFFFLIIDFKKT